MSFRKDFIWGAASAAYQMEGAWNADGKGLSIWDVFSRIPGKTFEGHTGDVACDHYNRYEEDVALWKTIGIQGYRFSISWPRVFPDGVGRINQKGLDFYDHLVDELLNHGISPWITLYHWDFPYELQCQGGWLNRDSADWFADYAAVVSDKLSDRVSHWLTINEPTAFVEVGYHGANHAPGLQLSRYDTARVVHNVLRAHGKAVQAIRSHAKKPVQVGLAHVDYVCFPASNEPNDIEAARAATFSMMRNTFSNNVCWMEPMVNGKYSDEYLAVLGDDAPVVLPGDFDDISQPLDFTGLNLYNGFETRMAEDGKPQFTKKPLQRDRTAAPRFGFPWEVHPQVLYWGPRFFYERYGKTIYIFENGMANRDYVSQDGQVHDPQRIEFLWRYLSELKRAASEGIDIGGYFQWSIMDDFEWPNGYTQRFGLIHVNFETQERILKDSAHWYKNVILSNGENL